MTDSEKLEDALNKRARAREQGGNIGKITSILRGSSSASIKCTEEEVALVETILAGMNKEDRQGISISYNNGYIDIHIAKKEEEVPEKKKDKKNNKQEEIEEKEDEDKDRKKKDKKKKKEEKKKAKEEKKKIKEAEKKNAQIKKEAQKRTQKMDKYLEKGSKAKQGTKSSLMSRLFKKFTKNKATTNAVSKVASKEANKVVTKATTKAATKAGTKVATKIAGKAVLKSVVKKIPLVSLVAGGVFAYQRVKDGDWKGALGEVTSGALGCIPGAGTAASVAVDAGLAARDIYVSKQEPEIEQVPERKIVPQKLKEEIAQRGQVEHNNIPIKNNSMNYTQSMVMKKMLERTH